MPHQRGLDGNRKAVGWYPPAVVQPSGAEGQNHFPETGDGHLRTGRNQGALMSIGALCVLPFCIYLSSLTVGSTVGSCPRPFSSLANTLTLCTIVLLAPSCQHPVKFTACRPPGLLKTMTMVPGPNPANRPID